MIDVINDPRHFSFLVFLFAKVQSKARHCENLKVARVS